MSKTKSSGISRLGRDSRPKYLGIKLFAGQKAKVGSMLVRQRGSKFIAGKNVKRTADDSLFALKEGVVNYLTKKKTRFDGSKKIVTIVNVE